MSHEDWKYRFIDDDRRRLLESPIEFSTLMQDVISSGEILFDSLMVEANRNELITEDRESLLPESAHRVTFILSTSKELFDIFVNSSYGMFGQYHDSPETGRRAVAEFLRLLLAQDEVDRQLTKTIESKAVTQAVPHPASFMRRTLDKSRIVLWFDEHEFPHQKIPKAKPGKYTAQFLIGATPQLQTPIWGRDRPIFHAGTRLRINGAWVAADGRHAAHESKIDIDIKLHKRGFS